MDRFVWPPGRSRPAAPSQTLPSTEDAPRAAARIPTLSPEPPTPRPIPPLQRAILDVERSWLGLVSPPAWIRAAEAGWQPDPSGAFCARCGTTRPGGDSIADGSCDACRGKRLRWSRAIRLGAYDGVLKTMVKEIKFHQQRATARWLGTILAEHIIHAVRDAGGEWVLVPVASSLRRRISRGIDHAMTLARAVGDRSGLEVVPALVRRRHTPEQAGLSASSRARNIAGAFGVRRGAETGGRGMILVDDVRTTGATLTAAAKALGAPPERVWAATLAVTERGGEKWDV